MIFEAALFTGGLIYVADRFDRWRRSRRRERAEDGASEAKDRRIDPFGLRRKHEMQGQIDGGGRSRAAADLRLDGQLALAGGALVLAAAGTLAWAPLLLASLPLFAVAIGDLYVAAWRRWRSERRLGLTLVDALTYTAALALGQILAAALMLLVNNASARLARLAEDRARVQLAHLQDRLPQRVWVVRGEVEVEVPLADVSEGDILAVEAGDIVPVDGFVSDGAARVDERLLTGESWPNDKAVGDRVFACTNVIEGRIRVRVERSGESTLTARLVQVMIQTDDYRALVRARGEYVAEIGVMPTLLASVVTLPLLGLEAALAVLFASFGQGMRHTGPIAALTYLRAAAANGILVKDGRALESLATVDTVVFDKTGTLTEDSFELGQVFVGAATDEATLLGLVAAAETRQEHPFAAALVEAAKARGVVVPALEDVSVEVGMGLRARINGLAVTIGSARLMSVERIARPEHLEARLAAESTHGASQIHVAVDGVLAGVFELLPRLRPEAQAVVDALHARGLRVEIVSGDREDATRAAAEALGVGAYRAGVLPSGKAAVIEALRSQGRRVCFVGDGINDALALRAADVPVSLASGSSIAAEAAAIVLMDGGLQGFVPLLDLARGLDRDQKIGTALSIAPGVATLAGVYLAGFGLVHAVVLHNVALGLALIHAMTPPDLAEPPRQRHATGASPSSDLVAAV